MTTGAEIVRILPLCGEVRYFDKMCGFKDDDDCFSTLMREKRVKIRGFDDVRILFYGMPGAYVGRRRVRAVIPRYFKCANQSALQESSASCQKEQ